MKHDTCERVKKLTSTLSVPEKEVLLKYLVSHLPDWQNESKLVRLLHTLSGEEEECTDTGYNRKNYHMLEDRILDSLLFDINLQRHGKYTEDANALLSLKKDGLKMRVLQERGLLQRAYQVAENIKVQSQREESYDTLIEALNFQLSMIGLQQDAGRFRKLTEEINHYEYCRFAKRKSLALLYELKMKKFNGLTENLDLFVKDSIGTLQRYRDRIQCHTIDFIQEYFIKEDFELEENWLEAHYYMTQLYARAEDLPRHTPHFNFWELAFEQARLCLKTGDGDTGLFLLLKCLKHLPEEHLAHQKAMPLAFQYYLDQDQAQAALRLAERYQQSRFYTLHLSAYRQHSWNFSVAAAHLRLGNTGKVKTLLQATREFEKFSVENALLVRFVKIMLAVELRKTDMADHFLEALRKQVSRHQWLAHLRELQLDRFYYALFKLRNTGYRFNEFSARWPDLLREVQQQEIRCSGARPVSFHRWLSKPRVEERVSHP